MAKKVKQPPLETAAREVPVDAEGWPMPPEGATLDVNGLIPPDDPEKAAPPILSPKEDHVPSIAELQAQELATLTAIRDHQVAARQANAVRHTSGSTSPLQQDRAAQNKCPNCGNEFLTVYQTVKICGPCGWRSDQHRMEPYE